MSTSPTIFERIIAREIPATIVYEDADCIAIQDIAPVAPVHILIIPKKVIRSVAELTTEDALLFGKLVLVAQEIARNNGLVERGYRIVTNVNEYGGQTVFHLHLHLLGGRNLGAMVSAVKNIPPTPVQPWYASTWGSAIIMIVLSMALAIVFNANNVKRIPWQKPVYASVPANNNDLQRLLENSDSLPTTTTTTALIKPDTTKKVVDTVKTSTTVVKTDTVPTQKKKFVPEPGVVREITLAQFKQLRTLEHVLFDARIPESYAKAHIAGAVNVDGTMAESPGVIQQLLSTPTDRIILIYCDGGDCELSHHVADVLKNFKYGPIFIYTGGWAEWSKLNK